MKPTVVLDVECYRNYFMVGVRNVETGRTRNFELYEDHPLDIEDLNKIVRRCKLVTFNGNNYDMPMVFLALSGASNDQLKKASDKIIVGNLKSWQFEKTYGLAFPKIDHIDLIEVAPGQASLKIYGGRVHTRLMQDLPIEPDAFITPVDREKLVAYNGNDLNATIDLLNKLRLQIDLREKMSDEYGIDLRSKSDAQIAEAVLKQEIEKLTGIKPVRPEVPAGTTFKYKVPDFISYKTSDLDAVLGMVRNAKFVVSDTGSVEMPAELGNAKVKIRDSIYRMGIGGLHSSEECVCHIADDETVLQDNDVSSYYPSIILNQGLYPKHLGPVFLKVYKGIVDRRLAAKHSGDKVTADSLKITINGSFGKLGSKWSTLYSPDLMIQVTITGQLALLMLIESIELAGIRVVSGNTDGIVIKCPKSKINNLNEIVKWWESVTKFDTEDTHYSAVYSRDVNNYIAFKPDGKAKLKGAYAAAGLQKNPNNEICVEAVVAYLKGGTPISKTITECEDIRKFVTVRSVTGGGEKVESYAEVDDWVLVVDKGTKDNVWMRQAWLDAGRSPDDQGGGGAVLRKSRPGPVIVANHTTYLGKAIRWYYGAGERGAIIYKKNGNKVPRSEGAVPLMNLPDQFPSNVDYNWYIRDALSILRDIGHPDYQWDERSDELI